jgi:hypothetical protein
MAKTGVSWYDLPEEVAMIELTPEQAQAIAHQGERPPTMLNPKTQETFVLIRKDVFELMRKWMEPFNRGWDDPALDIYNESSNQP